MGDLAGQCGQVWLPAQAHQWSGRRADHAVSSWADLAALRAAGHAPSGALTVFGRHTPHWRLRGALMDMQRMVIDHDVTGPFPLPLIADLDVLLMLDCEHCLPIAPQLPAAPAKPYRLQHWCDRCGLSSFVTAGCRP